MADSVEKNTTEVRVDEQVALWWAESVGWLFLSCGLLCALVLPNEYGAPSGYTIGALVAWRVADIVRRSR